MAVTPQEPGQHTQAAPDATRKAPLHNPGHPSLPLTQHARPAAVTGPAAWENGRDAVSVPRGTPPHANPSASFAADQDAQVTSTVGLNPDPPAQRSASVPADPTPRTTGNPLDWQPFSTGAY